MIFASAHLLQHIAATARAFDIIGKYHFNSVRISGMKTVIPAGPVVCIIDILCGEVEIVVVCDVALRVAGILWLKKSPVDFIDFQWIIHGKILAFI